MAPRSGPLRDIVSREVVRESAFPLGFALVAFATIAVGALVGVGGYYLLAPAQAPQAVVSAVTGRSAAPPAPKPVVDDGAWTDDDLRRCGQEATAAADAASQRKLAAVSDDRVGLGAPDPAMVQRTAYFLCSARSKPLHFCKAYWRKGLIASIKTYAADFHDVTSSAYWARLNLAERVARSANPDAPEFASIVTGIDQTTRDVARMNGEIVTAVRVLVADGIIAPEDFGVFFGFGIPPDIRAILGDGKAERHVCG